jgi:LIM-domain binding protein
MNYWRVFVERFFSPRGSLVQQLWSPSEDTKQYEIATPALPRYYHTIYHSGVKTVQLVLGNAKEKELENGSVVESLHSSFIYWFENGWQVSFLATTDIDSTDPDLQLVSSGRLRAQFDQNSKIDTLEFATQKHEEFIPRQHIQTLLQSQNSPDQKSSPKQNKSVSKQRAAQRQQPQPPIVLPESQVNDFGVTDELMRFLEVNSTFLPAY